MAEKIPNLFDELSRFVAQYGIERSKILQKRIIKGRPDVSWPITANFFGRKGYPALATNEGLRFFADNLK